MTQSNVDHKPTLCCVSITAIILFIVVFITVPTYVIPYFQFQEFEEEQCFINNILYPKINPSFENSNNWEECDCGKNCWSYSPCIKLFTNISSDFIQDVFPSNGDSCTFHQKRCSKGEDIRYINEYLNESLNTFESYINTTHTCYIDPHTNNIYLENTTSFEDMLISVIFIGIILLLCLFIIFYHLVCIKIEKREIKRETQNPAFNI